MNFDLWHKVYPMTGAWNTFVHQRTRMRGPYKYPWFIELFNADRLPAHSFKRWWINCSHVYLRIVTRIAVLTQQACGGDKKKFKRLWLGGARHYIQKLWPKNSNESDSDSESSEVEVEEVKVWKVGDEAEAKYEGEYYYGKIVKVFNNGNYSFHFDDGDKHRSIEPKFIRERTPIVSFDESDITDGLSEDEESSSESSASMEEEVTVTKKEYREALELFLRSQMKDYEYFLHGTRTNHTESFHNVANKYYSKGSTSTFNLYIMKKQFAALDWNEQKVLAIVFWSHFASF